MVKYIHGLSFSVRESMIKQKMKAVISKKAMVDTVIFSDICDGVLDVDLTQYEIHVTNIQKYELEHPNNSDQKKSFLENYKVRFVSEVGLYGIATYGQARYPTSLFLEILGKMNGLRRHKNNQSDSAILESAIHNKCILITRDGYLEQVARQYVDVVFYEKAKIPHNSTR